MMAHIWHISSICLSEGNLKTLMKPLLVRVGHETGVNLTVTPPKLMTEAVITFHNLFII